MTTATEIPTQASAVVDGSFTPGPWNIEGSIHTRVGEIGKIVSAGVNDYGDGPRSYVAKITEVSPDDLALMLSAPELLGALRKLTMLARTSGGVAGSDAELMDACSVAEAAIAKATGQ